MPMEQCSFYTEEGSHKVQKKKNSKKKKKKINYPPPNELHTQQNVTYPKPHVCQLIIDLIITYIIFSPQSFFRPYNCYFFWNVLYYILVWNIEEVWIYLKM